MPLRPRRALALAASLAASLAAFLAAFLAAAAFAPARAEGRPVVVELFTSQGCSSCPPAEAVLGALAGRADILPLGFHVTYWDRLGWRDPFSFEGATRRQSDYAAHLGAGTFTPQLVVDGRESVIGSRGGEVAEAIRRAAQGTGDAAPVALTRAGEGVAIRVGARTGAGSGGARVLLVGFDRQHRTEIRRGENGGRSLVQANVVRSIRDLGPWTGAALAFTEAAPAGADAAVLLQEPNGRIVGAARLGDPS